MSKEIILLLEIKTKDGNDDDDDNADLFIKIIFLKQPINVWVYTTVIRSVWKKQKISIFYLIIYKPTTLFTFNTIRGSFNR